MIEDFYSISDRSYSTDLLSVDTLRGLDVGLPTYNDMRTILNLNRFRRFKDFKNEMIGNEVGICDAYYNELSPEQLALRLKFV